MASLQDNRTLDTLAARVDAHAQSQAELYDQIDQAVAAAAAKLDQERTNAGLARTQAAPTAAPGPPQGTESPSQ